MSEWRIKARIKDEGDWETSYPDLRSIVEELEAIINSDKDIEKVKIMKIEEEFELNFKGEKIGK